MIRYRTRDITRLIAAPCGCGRTLRGWSAFRAAATICSSSAGERVPVPD